VARVSSESFGPSPERELRNDLKADLKSTWRLLKPHAKPRIPALFLLAILNAVSTFGQTLVVLLLEPIWNLVLFPRKGEAAENVDPGPIEEAFAWITRTSVEQGFIRGEARQNEQYAALCVVVIFLILVALITTAAQYAHHQLAAKVSLRMVVDLRVRIARHLMGLSLGWHGSRKLGDTLSRVSSDAQQTLSAVKLFFGDMLQNGNFTIWYMGLMIYAAPELATVVLITMPLLAWPISKLSKRVRKSSTKSLTTLGASVQVLTQMFQGIRTVRAFDMEDREVDRYEELNEEFLKDSMRMVRAQSLAQVWTSLFSHVGTAVLLFAVGFGAIWFDLFGDGGKMMIFFMGSAQMYNHMKRLTRNLTALESSVGASERLAEVLEEEADIRELPGAHKLTEITGEVRIEGLKFAYPNAAGPALSGIDLVVRPGETLALVGPSGGGKSTLLSMICRFFDPDEGSIWAGGHDLREVKVRSWRQQFSLVEQAPFLFHSTIRENIRYGRLEATQEEIEEAATSAHIHDFIESLPEGYDTDVADMGTRLSGGQRQRITIARAFLKGAPLLLLDEATSSLDSESESAVQAALENVMRDRTVVVIAHRLATIRNADRIAVLEDGTVSQTGTHAELIAAGGTYSRLVEMQQIQGVEPRETGAEDREPTEA
jgi:subfamily B ATP-binding cassette protein MsbA